MLLGIQKAEEIVASDPAKYLLLQQFSNPANPEIHEKTTGPEIWEQMGQDMDAIVFGCGSSGTMTGLSRFFETAAPHVEHRPHVQCPDRRVRVPGAAGAVLFEHVGEPSGVFGKMFERHGAVLDEGHRLAVAFHRHHDVQAGLAHFPQGLLRRLVGHRHHAARQAQVAESELSGASAAWTAARDSFERGSPGAVKLEQATTRIDQEIAEAKRRPPQFPNQLPGAIRRR